MQITTIGLDTAKNLFQVHGAAAQGRTVLKRRLARAKVLEFFGHPAALLGWAGSLRCGPLLGTRADEAGAQGPPDTTAVRASLCENQQARCRRRGGLLRGGHAAWHAFRAGEERGPA